MARTLVGRRGARRAADAAPEPEPETGPEPTPVGVGKGRPTPTRRQAQAARRTRSRTPRTRQEARIAAREERRERQLRMREAMATGDERYLPQRDQGPVRRWVRDWVDSRRHLAEYSLPFVLAVTFLSIPFSGIAGAAWVPNVVLLVVVLVVVGDALLTARRIRTGIAERFGPDQVKGNVMYGVMRSTQFRRIRQPKPQRQPGDRAD